MTEEQLQEIERRLVYSYGHGGRWLSTNTITPADVRTLIAEVRRLHGPPREAR